MGITEYADGAKEKAKGAALQKTMVAGAVGGVTAVAAIATGGIALGVAAGAAALVGGVGAQAEYKLVADAAQGEVDAMEVQQALGPLMDKKDWIELGGPRLLTESEGPLDPGSPMYRYQFATADKENYEEEPTDDKSGKIFYVKKNVEFDVMKC